jgi:hypothetical protein
VADEGVLAADRGGGWGRAGALAVRELGLAVEREAELGLDAGREAELELGVERVVGACRGAADDEAGAGLEVVPRTAMVGLLVQPEPTCLQSRGRTDIP